MWSIDHVSVFTTDDYSFIDQVSVLKILDYSIIDFETPTDYSKTKNGELKNQSSYKC